MKSIGKRKASKVTLKHHRRHNEASKEERNAMRKTIRDEEASTP